MAYSIDGEGNKRKMTCNHQNASTSREARAPSSKNALRRPFQFLRSRKCKCHDCGEVFNSFELTEQQVIDLMDGASTACFIADLKQLMQVHGHYPLGAELSKYMKGKAK